MAYTIDDYINAQGAAQQAEQSAQIAGVTAGNAENALVQGRDVAGYPASFIADHLEPAALSASAQSRLAGIAARDAARNAEGQATREHLEEMLEDMDQAALRRFIDVYEPSFDGNDFNGPEGTYADAARIHRDRAQMQGLLTYVGRGENNVNTNELVGAAGRALIEEDIRDRPDEYFANIDHEHPDFEEYVAAAREIAYASEKVARDEFRRLAPDAIGRRTDALYEAIGDGEEDARAYITGTIADGDIGAAFDAYAQAHLAAQRR